MITVLLFDADGVLLLHTDKWFSQRLGEYLNIPHQEIMPFFEKVFEDCIVGLKDLKEEIAPYATAWGWKGTVDELLDFWFEYEHNADEPLIDYVRDAKLRGVRSFIATNNEKYRADALFEYLNLDEAVFEKVYAAGHLKVAKPDIKFFQHIYAEMSNIDKKDILFWDDTEKNVAAAKAFGFQAELYTTFEDFTKKMEHYV